MFFPRIDICLALLISVRTVVGADADVERLQAEAEAGNASSQCLLGNAYLYGEGTPQNFQKAVFWLRKSAAATNQAAQVLLYQCFVSGTGVPKSEAHQIGILRKLSNEGDHASQRLLGLKLSNKALEGWNTNAVALNVEAYKWLSLASTKIPSAAKDRENVRLEMSAASTTAAQRQAELFRPSPPTALVFTDDWRIIPQKQHK